MSSRLAAEHDPAGVDSPIDPSEQPRVARKRRRANRTALAAHGEPMVWLTGGCLAVCLVMIVGLLLLVLANGATTFWPRPLVKVTTIEGEVYMGEPAREETYRLTESMVATKSQALRTAADKLLTETYDFVDPVTGETISQRVGVADRKLYRTGNFRLTNEHFNWVADFEVVEAVEPEWAVVIERETWGRFYGFPKVFVLHHSRPVGERERMLAELDRLLSRGVRRLPRDQRASAQATADQVAAELQTVRGQAVSDFLADYKSPGRVKHVAELDDRKTVPLSDVEPGQNVVAVQELWEGEERAYAKYVEHHGYVEGNLDKIHGLEEEAGAGRHRENEARMALRRVELEYGRRLLQREQAERKAKAAALEPGDGEEGARGWFDFAPVPSRVITLIEHGNDLIVQLNIIDQIKLEVDGRAALLERVVRRYGKDSAQAGFAAQAIAQADARAAEAQAEAQAEIDKVRQRMDRQFARYADEIGDVSEALGAAVDEYVAVKRETQKSDSANKAQIAALKADNGRFEWRMATADGERASVMFAEIVRAYMPAQLSFGDKLGVYFSRWGEFLAADPREANQEGGVFPQIVGTVLMTILMAVAVVPFGVVAALYLREYAKAGPIVSAVRIAINNLAGVPSIVFGVFGLGFFCYMIGGYVDRGPTTVIPGRQWFITLSLFAAMVVFGGLTALLNRGGTKTRGSGTPFYANALLAAPLAALWLLLFVLAFVTPHGMIRAMVVVIGAILALCLFHALQPKPNDQRSRVQRAMYVSGMVTCLLASCTAVFLVAVTPFFDGFFAVESSDKTPTFGKGALIWASFTLALLTLPVVIVATEEALSAVPNSMREGSYACGASKWQTIKRIVLPRAMPGIMTGMILAMARGAGEVAPLMLVGAAKIASELPISTEPPFGVNRSFLHLGFHIYDLGFQSPNAEAAKPMVFTTTLLLILIVALLNLVSIWLRTRLRRKFDSSAF